MAGVVLLFLGTWVLDVELFCEKMKIEVLLT